jgi:hypothetical protein
MNSPLANGHVASNLFRDPTAATTATFFGGLSDPSQPETLSELVEAFDRTEALHHPDIDVPVRALTMSEHAHIIVPDLGPCALTPWAKKQLASRLGIKWDLWFDGIDGKLRSDEVNRRLSRDDSKIRVKTTIGAGGDSGAVATLRGLVSTSYATIPDALVGHAILEELRAGDPKVIRCTTTDRTTSYVVRVGQPIHLGGPAQVGDVVGGLLVRNSDVGYSSLVIALHVTRLVCRNGLVVAENKSIVHRAHRRIDLADLKEKLTIGLRDLPSRIQRAARTLERSAHHRVEHVEAALVEILRLARVPQRRLPVFVTAYEKEPHASPFGITQAITLGAQDRSLSAEERIALEQAAGEYVQRFAAGVR